MASGDLTVILFGDEDDPRSVAWRKRCEANRRYQCEDCNAFISDDAGKRQMVGRSWMFGDDSGPTCEPGKGCNRKAPDA